MNQTVHTINLMITTVGTPVEVFAYTACLAHERIEVEDTAVAVVKFASGALGTIHGTTAAYPGLDASLRVFGAKGSAVISNDELTYLHQNAGPAPEIGMAAQTGGNQVTDEDRLDPAELGLGAAHRRQLADFVEAVRAGRPPRVGTAEARTALVGDPRDVRVRRLRPSREALRRTPDDQQRAPRLAVNPIAYWLAGGVPDRTTRTLGPAFTELADIGYTAVKADVPDDMARRRLPALARVVRAGARAEPLQRRVRRPGHARGAGRGGPACSRPGRRRSASGSA